MRPYRTPSLIFAVIIMAFPVSANAQSGTGASAELPIIAKLVDWTTPQKRWAACHVEKNHHACEAMARHNDPKPDEEVASAEEAVNCLDCFLE